MIDPVRELKIRAEILQHRIASRQPAALARLRRLPEFRAYSDDALEAVAARVLRRHCLTLLATELGFQGWPSAKAALSGTGSVVDFGTVLYPKRCGGHLNLWYVAMTTPWRAVTPAPATCLPIVETSWSCRDRSSRCSVLNLLHRSGVRWASTGFAHWICARARDCTGHCCRSSHRRRAHESCAWASGGPPRAGSPAAPAGAGSGQAASGPSRYTRVCRGGDAKTSFVG